MKTSLFLLFLSSITFSKDLALHLGKECRTCSVCFLKSSPNECLDEMVPINELDSVPFKWKCAKTANQKHGTYVYGLNNRGLEIEKELCSYSESNLFFFRSSKEGGRLTLHSKSEPNLCLGIREKEGQGLQVQPEKCDGSAEQHLVWVYGESTSKRIP